MLNIIKKKTYVQNINLNEFFPINERIQNGFSSEKLCER